PVRAAVVRAPQLPALGLLVVPWHAVAGLDERVNAAWIRPRDGDRVLAGRLRRQAMAAQARPREAAVARHEQPAAGPSAFAAPRVDFELPHAGEDLPRVLRIHRQVRAAGVLVDEQRALPRLAAVRRPIDAALLLRPVR